MYIFILLAINTSLAFAQSQNHPLENQYLELCQQDLQNCLRLKENNHWKQPPSHSIIQVKRLRENILYFSKKYNIDPLAVAGVILTEETLNVSMTDYMQKLAVMIMSKLHIVPWEKMSYGIGQLTYHASKSANIYMSEYLHQRPFTEEELVVAPFHERNAVELIAVLIRKAQDDYAFHGIDISKKIELLSTLYNLGESEKRAFITSSQNRPPAYNYFGFYTLLIKKKLESVIYE